MIALSTGSLYTFGLARVFALAAQTGFEGIEVLVDERWDTRQAGYLSRLSARYNLPICSLHVPFVPHLSGWPSDPIERVHTTVELAQALGTRTVVLHPPLRVGYVLVSGFRRRLFLPTLPSPFKRMRNWLQDGAIELQERSGVRLCLENMPARRFLGRQVNFYWWNRLDEWSRFRHLTLDTTHLGTWGLDPLQVYRRVKTQVRHIHLANFNGRQHRRLDDGHLALGDLVHALSSDGYAGAIVVELQPDALEAEDEARVREHLEAQVRWCRQHLAR